MDGKSRKYIFLEVSDESKSWRLYDSFSKKNIVSKKVVFEQKESWIWNKIEEELKQDALGEDGDGQNEEESGSGSKSINSKQ